MTQPTPDARAVVRALDALTTQVRRVADGLWPTDQQRADDAATTGRLPVLGIDPGTNPDMVVTQWMPDPPGAAEHRARVAEWITRGTRDLSVPEQASAADEDPDATCRLMVTRTCPPSYRGPCGDRPCARIESDDPTPWLDEAVKRSRPFPYPSDVAEDQAPLRAQLLADEAQALRWARRESLLVLLTRLQRGRPLTEAEAGTLRHHVETEISDADDARRHASQANEVTAQAKRLLDRRGRTLRERAESAETELRTLRCGLRAAGADPTQIQNLWAQLRVRNRQWAEAKREARAFRAMLDDEGGDVALVDEMLATVDKSEARAREAQDMAEQLRAFIDRGFDTHAKFSVIAPDGSTEELPCADWCLACKIERAEATIERVREAVEWARRHHPGLIHVNDRLRAALDGTEQPAAEAQQSGRADERCALCPPGTTTPHLEEHMRLVHGARSEQPTTEGN